jgi:hypothetical protein
MDRGWVFQALVAMDLGWVYQVPVSMDREMDLIQQVYQTLPS